MGFLTQLITGSLTIYIYILLTVIAIMIIVIIRITFIIIVIVTYIYSIIVTSTIITIIICYTMITHIISHDIRLRIFFRLDKKSSGWTSHSGPLATLGIDNHRLNHHIWDFEMGFLSIKTSVKH